MFEYQIDDAYGNTEFPCGKGDYGYTLCPPQSADKPEGFYVVAYNLLDQPVTLEDPDYYYTYAFVFDSDGDSANNWVPLSQYPKDFFKDTDRWFVINYAPSSGWSMEVSDVRSGSIEPIASGARITISEGALMLVVPLEEFDDSTPQYRVTSFRHRGDFGLQPPHDWTGDIVPTVDEPLATVQP